MTERLVVAEVDAKKYQPNANRFARSEQNANNNNDGQSTVFDNKDTVVNISYVSGVRGVVTDVTNSFFFFVLDTRAPAI